MGPVRQPCRPALALISAALVVAAPVAPGQTVMPTGDPAEVWQKDVQPIDVRPLPSSNADPGAVVGARSGPDGTTKETRVLCLHSHSPDDSYTMLQSIGFSDAYKARATGPVSMYREYLFLSLRSEDDAYLNSLVTLLSKRYRDVPIDVVMITDSRALHFWLDHLRRTLPGIPAVFSGPYEWLPEFDSPTRNFTGAMESIDFVGTVNLIRRLRPGTRHVAVMTTEGIFGRRMRDAFSAQLAALGAIDVKTSHYVPMTWDQVLAPFTGPGAADALIYIAGPVGLTPGKHQFPPNWLQSRVPGGVPTFALFDAALGPDVIGGMVCSGRRMGQIAGEAAARIVFDRVPPAEIPIDKGAGSFVPMFRWQSLEKWGVRASELPPGSVVIGRPESWLVRNEAWLYRFVAFGATGTAVALAGATWVLFASRRRWLVAEAELARSKQRLRQAVDGADLGTWECDVATGTMVGSDRFCDLYGLERGKPLLKEEGLPRIHPADREAVTRAWVECVDGVAPFRAVYRFRVTDGCYRWFKVDGDLVHDGRSDTKKVAGVSADITELAEARIAAETSEHRMAALIRTAPVGIIEWDDRWRCTRWDGRAEAIFGWRADEVIGKSYRDWQFIYPPDTEAVVDVIRRQDESRLSQFSSLNRNLTKEGAVRCCEWVNTNVFDQHGSRVSTLSIVTDVTDRETAREALAASEERYRLASAAVSDTIYDWYIRTDRVRKSGNSERLPTASVHVEHTVAEFVAALHPDDVARVKSSLNDALAAGATHWSAEYRHRLRDGSWGVFTDRAVIVRDEAGAPVRMVGAMSEVTQQRIAEAALRESEERFRLALRASTDIIWDWDLTTDSVQWSDAVTGLAKGSSESMSIDEWLSHIHPDERGRVGAGFHAAIRDPSFNVWRDEYRIATESGGYATYTDHGIIIRDAAGKALRMVGAMSDVTALRDAARRIAESERRLRAALDAAGLGTFDVDLTTGRMSHDERSGAILGLRPGESLDSFEARKARFHPEDVPGVNEREKLALQTPASYRCEARARQPDGQYRWILGQAEIIRNESGTPVRAVGVIGDIHERKTAEAALQESETRFRQLAETIDECFWEGHPAPRGGMRYVSPAVVRVYGMTSEQVLSTPLGWSSAFHPEDRESALAAADRWASSGFKGTYECQYRVVHSDGSVHWVENRGYAVRDASDRLVSIVGTARDVTARVEAARRVTESEAKFRELAERLPQVFWIADPSPDGAITYVSPAVKQVFGLDPSQIEGSCDGWARLIHPDDIDAADHRRLEWHARGCIDSYDNRYRIVRPDGEVRHIVNRAYGVRGSDGGLDRVVGLATDVTIETRVVIDLGRSEQRFREMAENIDQVFWVRSITTDEILYVSPATKRLWGVDPEALLGSIGHWRALIHEDDRRPVRSRIESWIRSGMRGQYDSDFRIVIPSGEVRWVRSRAVAITEAGSLPERIVGVTEDITHRKQAELALESTLRAQQLLLSELDHRVKNALAGLLSMIDMSARESVSVEVLAAAMQRRVQAMVSVHTMLSEARWRPVALHAMVERLIPPGGAQRVLVYGPEVTIMPRQATALGMVLQELFSNSGKYGALGSAEGVVQVSWTIESWNQTSDRRMLLRWKESGGPPITRPPTEGLGVSLIRGFAGFELGGSAELGFLPQGVCHTIEIRLDAEAPESRGTPVEAGVGSQAEAK